MEEKYGARFFCPLLPGFTKKLLISQELVKNHIRMDENRKTAATIVTSNGKIWQVDFYKEPEDAYIGGTGWENLVKAQRLRDYDVLVFRYRGNMVFSIRIFDKTTCCEKKHSFDFPMGAEKNTTFSENEDDGTSNVVQEKPTKSSCKKRKIQEMSHSTSEDSTPVRSQDQVPAKMERNYSRKLSFEGIIRASDQGSMYIPSTFTKSIGLDKLSEVTLIDPKNRRWAVSVRHYHKGRYNKISRGWTQFAVGNDLQEGDKCIFEVIPKKSSTELRVQILRR